FVERAVFSAGLAAVRSDLADRGLVAGDFDIAQAGAGQPRLDDAAGRQAESDAVAVQPIDLLAIELAIGPVRLEHFLMHPLGNAQAAPGLLPIRWPGGR